MSFNVRINIMYKRKAQKILFVNTSASNEFISRDEINWKNKLKSLVQKDDWKIFINFFEKFLTLKFSEFAKKARLILKRIDKLIIETQLWSRERKLFIEMLHNRETTLI